MEKENHDFSSLPVPCVLQDLTILNTPLPQATSTVNKKRFSYSYIADPELKAALEESDSACTNVKMSTSQPESSKKSQTTPALNIADETERSLKDSYETMIKEKEEINNEIAKISGTKGLKIPESSLIPEFNIKYHETEIAKLLNIREVTNIQEKQSNPSTLSETKVNSFSKEHCGEEFKFLIPGSPLSTKRLYSDSVKKNKKQVGTCRDNSSTIKRSSILPASHTSKNISTNRKISISSSTDSSLGIISSTDLEELVDQPLVEFSEQDKFDLSQRLAKELNLDTSFIYENKLDISQLASAHMKERLSNTFEENKENSQQRGSINHLITYGCEKELENKMSFQMTKKPLSEQNAIISDSFFHQSMYKLPYQSNNDRESVSSNPFSNYSKVSVGSEVFQSGEDIIERLQNDEDVWRRGQFGRDSVKSSLSGIYGDGNISLSTENDKLSISSFLRSKSGPLGSLERSTEDSQRPTFGHPVISPEKKYKVRPIIPPSEEKLTFLVDEVPTKDIEDSWNHKFKTVDQCDNDSDVSVPSLSCIGDLMSDKHSDQTPREMIDRLIAATQKKKLGAKSYSKFSASLMKLNDNSALSFSVEADVIQTIPSLVEGDTSFCRGYERNSITRYNSRLTNKDLGNIHEEKPSDKNHSIIILEDSVVPSVCDVTDFGGGEAECVCVLMPQSMVFDIFNNNRITQYYSIMKTCYLNGIRQESAALVHIPETCFILQPGETNFFKVIVVAVLEGTIKIKLEITRTDPESNESEMTTVFGKIVSEVPKISLLSSSSIVMKPVVIYGNKSYEQYQEIIMIKNCGRSLVPLKLIITQMTFTDMDIFFFNQEGNRTVKFKLEPGQTSRQIINCQAPLIFDPSNDPGESLLVTACVEAHLDTAAQAQLPPLLSIRIDAHLSPNLLCAPSSLSVQYGNSVSYPLCNSSSSPVTLQAFTSPDFTVRPAVVVINPGQTVTLLVTYSGGHNKDGTLTIIKNHVKYVVKLHGNISPNSSCTSLVTPGSSRAPSPTSPCSVTLRGLRIFCTQKELVWGGCPLQQRMVKTCSLKNQHNHREKLRLKVTDQLHCFKILNEKNCLESEIKLSLQPMESRQISVVIVAGSIGPKWGHLIISRINSPLDKNVIPLYAFGGKAKINIESVLQDPEQHMWIYLDSNSLSSTFKLTNRGDHTAFFKITEGMSATVVGGGLSIAPPEGCLQPGQSMSVKITLYITLERLEYLLADSSQSAICITRLSVVHGDESSRQRLGRLSSINTSLANKMSVLNTLQPEINIPNLDRLGEPHSCAETLWLEDISEWTIGILILRSALESLRLDTSCQFVDLCTTVIEK